MKIKQVMLVVGISAATTLISIWGLQKLHGSSYTNTIDQSGKLPVNYAGFNEPNEVRVQQGIPVDFTAAASAATPAVVHIKTLISASRTVSTPQGRNPFADLFGEDFGDIFGGGGGGGTMRVPEQRASGSGVLVSSDGYIVTNNHVVDKAIEINVTLNNKKSYKAELIGTDPSSDLAVLKIKGENFPYLTWGNSDEVKLGQWVLAVGYPWTLDVTVTAGIVSAKGRTLGLNRAKSKSPIESYIQTDAAVNQGSSGGALVSTNGNLIGINSAIASPTGSYAGYSYAIPVNIVKKIVSDLMKFGTVQRAYLGLSYMPDEMPEEELRKQNIKMGEGVYVSAIPEDGAAKQAGIKTGDYITGINGVKVKSGSEMVEQIANYKPGDKITVAYTRAGKEYTTNVTLTNKSGNYNIVKSEASQSIEEKLGGEFEAIDKKAAVSYGIPGGVRVKKIGTGLLKASRIQQDFVITSVNGETVTSVEVFKTIISRASGIVKLEGIYPGFESTYAYPLNLNDGEDTSTGESEE